MKKAYSFLTTSSMGNQMTAVEVDELQRLRKRYKKDGCRHFCLAIARIFLCRMKQEGVITHFGACRNLDNALEKTFWVTVGREMTTVNIEPIYKQIHARFVSPAVHNVVHVNMQTSYPDFCNAVMDILYGHGMIELHKSAM
jgi:hypothetical protein